MASHSWLQGLALCNWKFCFLYSCSKERIDYVSGNLSIFNSCIFPFAAFLPRRPDYFFAQWLLVRWKAGVKLAHAKRIVLQEMKEKFCEGSKVSIKGTNWLCLLRRKKSIKKISRWKACSKKSSWKTSKWKFFLSKNLLIRFQKKIFSSEGLD